MIKKLIFAVLIIIGLSSCSVKRTSSGNTYNSTKHSHTLYNDYMFLILNYSEDETYGYTEKNPIMVGAEGGSGPENERRFLNALAGPNGEEISYYRMGSCCAFQTENSAWGGGMLDKYHVSYEGNKDGVVLYINMYDSDSLFIPIGFTRRL